MGRILVIDDESNIRLMIKLALQHVGHSVETATDGQEGLEKFGNGEAVDLVLLDYRMPGLSGMEVLREIRTREPSARVAIITAFGTVDLAEEAMRAGAIDFLRKPFTAEVLREAVEAALAQRGETGTPEASSSQGFRSAALNGFRIQPREEQETAPIGGDLHRLFAVRGPRGESRDCAVLLPGYVIDRVREHAEGRPLPSGDRFWQDLCEEALANYIWQHADFPPDRLLRVDDLTTSMRRKVDSAIAARSF
jgi:CheY-like chemotaxis protein